MPTQQFTTDLGVGLVGSLVGARVMEPVTVKLQELTSEQDKKREKAVSPGSPYALAVDRFSDFSGLQLADGSKKQLASLMPYVAAMGAGPAYAFFRRALHLNPWPAGIASGLLLFLGVDEGLIPAFGLSAPDRAYPVATHLRGLLGHLVFGLGIAATGATAEAAASWSRPQTRFPIRSRPEPPLAAAIKGAIAGLAGAAAIRVAMQQTPAIMEQLSRAGLAPAEQSQPGANGQHEEPPAKLAGKVASQVFEAELDKEAKDRAAQAIHWTYGAGWGALYGLIQSRLRLPHTLHGALLGGLVGGVASTVVPAMELSPSPKQQPLAMTALQFLQHLLYGEVTALAYRLLSAR